MPAPLAIILPTLNSAASLPQTLERAFEGVPSGLVGQLVISDGGSADDTVAIAEAAGATLVTGTAGRGGQLQRGAQSTTAPWLLFLHSDSLLPEGWADLVAAHIATGAGPATFRIRFDRPGLGGRITAAWANTRTHLFNLPYGDQALLISHADYSRAGGYDDIPLMEDVALVRKLRRRVRLLPASITTSGEKYHRNGWFVQGAHNFLTLARYLLGADPATLARAYNRR